MPGAYSETDEIVALAKVARRYGLPYTTHMRDEERELASALDEAIEIGRRAGVRVQISHCKAAVAASPRFIPSSPAAIAGSIASAAGVAAHVAGAAMISSASTK